MLMLISCAGYQYKIVHRGSRTSSATTCQTLGYTDCWHVQAFFLVSIDLVSETVLANHLFRAGKRLLFAR
jgi:hypothetical protein